MVLINELTTALKKFITASTELSDKEKKTVKIVRVSSVANRSMGDLPILIKEYLQNNLYNVLVAVRQGDSLTSRVYNRVPLTEKTPFEVYVLTTDGSKYHGLSEQTSLEDSLRDKVTLEVKQFFRVNPQFGTEKSTQNVGYQNMRQRVVCSCVIVTHLNENLK